MTHLIKTLSFAGAMLSVAASANAQGTADQQSACIGRRVSIVLGVYSEQGTH